MGKRELKMSIPTGLNEITLEQYQRIQGLSGDDEQSAVKIVSVLCNITENEVRGLQVPDFNDIINTLSLVLNRKSIFQQRVTINKVEYGFIPNLDNITLGEYIDLDKFIRDEKDLHKTMSILYREITETNKGLYRIKDYEAGEHYEVMKQIPLDVVRGSMVFFYNLGNELLNHMPDYLMEQVNKSTVFKDNLEQGGDGTVASLNLQMKSLKELTQLLEKIFTKHSHFSLSFRRKAKLTMI